MNDQDAPHPWLRRYVVMTGGLVGAGFADASDLLLVVTHDGRGLVDCLSGEKIARDNVPSCPDEVTREVPGIGPVSAEQIVIAGEIFGGSLRHQSADGWRLEGVLTNSSEDKVTLIPPPEQSSLAAMIFTDFVPEIRVFGFSPTGQSFIIGTGAEVFIFAR